MGFHTFPVERSEELEDPARFRFCSREELIELLNPDSTDRVVELGSGTGFFSAEIAPFVGTLYAVDLQSGMHRRFREIGVPSNTFLVNASVSALPFDDGVFDLAYSVQTHHEYYTERAMNDVARTMRSGGRLVTVDWSVDKLSDIGPPPEQRFQPEEIIDHLVRAGFEILQQRVRPETVAIAARRV